MSLSPPRFPLCLSFGCEHVLFGESLIAREMQGAILDEQKVFGLFRDASRYCGGCRYSLQTSDRTISKVPAIRDGLHNVFSARMAAKANISNARISFCDGNTLYDGVQGGTARLQYSPGLLVGFVTKFPG